MRLFFFLLFLCCLVSEGVLASHDRRNMTQSQTHAHSSIHPSHTTETIQKRRQSHLVDKPPTPPPQAQAPVVRESPRVPASPLSPAPTANPVRALNHYYHHFKACRDRLRNDSTYNRTRELAPLQTYRGPYQDAAKSKALGLQNAVILMVHVQENEAKIPALSMFRNTQCHMARHGLQAVLSLSRNYFRPTEEGVTGVNATASEMFVDNDTLKLLPFPDELFWDTMLTVRQYNRVFDTTPPLYPTFREYGDFIKMIPLLELLLIGKSVFLMDDDVLLVRNPIPFIFHGNADMVSMEEKRVCEYSGRPIMYNEISSIFRFHSQEINLGFIMMHPTIKNINFLKNIWYQAPVSNGNLGKSSLSFHSKFEESHSCKLRRFDNSIQMSESSVNTSKPTLCLLSETLFQNGYVNGPQCGKFGNAPMYRLVLAEEILSLTNILFPDNSLPEDMRLDHRDLLREIIAFENSTSFRVELFEPIVIHLNYNSIPKTILAKRHRMWLLNENKNVEGKYNYTCAAFTREQPFSSIATNVQQLINLRRHEMEKLFPADQSCPYMYVSPYNSPLKNISIVYQFNLTSVQFEAFPVIRSEEIPFTSHAKLHRHGSVGKNTFKVTIKNPNSSTHFMEVDAIPFAFSAHHMVTTYPIHHYVLSN